MRKQIFARARWWAILTSDPETREKRARFQGVLVELKKGGASREAEPCSSGAPGERCRFLAVCEKRETLLPLFGSCVKAGEMKVF